MEQNQHNNWLTIEELAERWRVSDDTMRRIAANKTIPSMRVGNQYRIARDVIEEIEREAKAVRDNQGLREVRKMVARAITAKDHYPDC